MSATERQIDRLARRLAGRLPRRTAIAGGAALTAASLLPRMPSLAQPATPLSTPVSVPPDVPLLFVQVFEGGNVAPLPGIAGSFLLSLSGNLGPTVAFSDRPARFSEAIPTERFADVLSFAPTDPPNAALVARVADAEVVLIVELTEPTYDSVTRTATYVATPLPDGGRFAESFGDRAVAVEQLPPTFGLASLFIDSSGDCVGFGQHCQAGGTPCCQGQIKEVQCFSLTCTASGAEIGYTPSLCLY